MTAAAPARDVVTVGLWRLLSLALSTLSQDTLEEAHELARALTPLTSSPELESFADACERSSAETLLAAQARLFAGKTAVSPCEGSYEDDPFRQARQMADIAGFYRAFGAEPHGPMHERPDHAGCELEFLAYLGARRVDAAAAGDDEQSRACEEAERAFLREHAGRWLPAFFRAVGREAEDGFHRTLGALGARVVEEELARRGLQADSAAPRTRRLEVEEDEIVCGGDAMNRILTRHRAGRR